MTVTVNGKTAQVVNIEWKRPPNRSSNNTMTLTVGDLENDFNTTLDYFEKNTSVELCMTFTGACRTIDEVIPSGKTCKMDVALWTRKFNGPDHRGYSVRSPYGQGCACGRPA